MRIYRVRLRTPSPPPKRLAALATCALAAGLPGLALARPAAANVIFNPSFGSGLSGWRTIVLAKGREPGYPHVLMLTTPREPLLKCDRAQTHHHFLQLNVPAGAAAFVEQSIIIPVRPSRLTFRTWGQLERVNVTVSIVSGPLVHRLLSYAPPPLGASPSGCSGKRPLTESLDVGHYAGQAVGLRVQATSQALSGALADFDSFSLGAR